MASEPPRLRKSGRDAMAAALRSSTLPTRIAPKVTTTNGSFEAAWCVWCTPGYCGKIGSPDYFNVQRRLPST